MCGRYDLGEALSYLLDGADWVNPPEGIKLSGEIFPSDLAPVLANSRRGGARPFAMRWGYSAGARRIINARAETAAAKSMFKDGMLQRRCLIPAACYYEWERRGKDKIKYAIHPVNEDRMFLAGIYHFEAQDEAVVPAFTILTREAAPEIAFIHERMPVILPENAAQDWLNREIPAEDVLRSALLNMEYEPVH